MITWSPIVSACTVRVAVAVCPVAGPSVAGPSGVAPSKKATLPLGEPLFSVTLAVKVTAVSRKCGGAVAAREEMIVNVPAIVLGFTKITGLLPFS